jgi:predicted nucleotidyltransferase
MRDARLQRILDALRQEMSQVLGDRLDAIILFGSQARGDAQDGSDIDVLIVVRGEFDYGDLIRRTSASIAALCLENDVVISRAFVSKDQFEREHSPFLLNVRREGVPV